MTQVSTLFNKRWRDWVKWNPKVISEFESLEGRSLVREEGPSNRRQSYVAIKLALRALNDYNIVFSWHVFSSYCNSLIADKEKISRELLEANLRVELRDAEIAKLKNNAIDVDLVGGDSLLYGYSCNGRVKFGTSFCNINGQRPKSHKTSVPNLAIGFVVYASKENLQDVNRAIKRRFRVRGRLEHVDCGVSDLELFVTQYLEVMGFNYKKEVIQKLKLLNIFLHS